MFPLTFQKDTRPGSVLRQTATAGMITEGQSRTTNFSQILGTNHVSGGLHYVRWVAIRARTPAPRRNLTAGVIRARYRESMSKPESTEGMRLQQRDGR